MNKGTVVNNILQFSDNEPNDETLAAMEEAINGNNLETLNIDDLNKLINNS